MNIKISILLIHCYPILIYWIVWLIYRHFIHPSYRWNQRGNICYDDARGISLIWTFVISFVIGFLYHTKDMGVIITW